ncbi:hypothetical protein BBK82_21845 [Lentzea guizhouensis]|uniref:Uncharacterized protein n=1 Tax=Lentzea guizhouensis TaxID=1586287 RepID=A0A1B2HKR5_9PSEU|nr:hypothetical protein BBK82_21845 [Lentzea guizhouensis]
MSGTVHVPVVQVGGDVHGGIHFHAAPEISWPVRVGVVPREADCYQSRPADAALSCGLTVLVGTGGVGKTQTAARHARGAGHDVVVWVTATTTQTVLAGYAEAAARLLLAEPGTGVTTAATRFLSWLQTAERTWLIVLDDVVDPAAMRGLWPSGSGQTLVTTRRRDSSILRADANVVDVTIFSAEQSESYLAAKLAAHPRLHAGAATLAAAVHHLPLALAQAVAYLVDRGLTCHQYVDRFQHQRLTALAPEPSGLPDDHRATVAVTWSLSIGLATSLAPLAKPMLQLASLLDPHGVPTAVLTNETILRGADGDDAADTVRCLHRLGLVELSTDGRMVTMHPLVQRVTREDMTAAELAGLAHPAAFALAALWETDPLDPALVPSLRANTSALMAAALHHLVGPGCHAVLFACGENLRRAGLLADARQHYEQVLRLAHPLLGGEHEEVLFIRISLANIRGDLGDIGGAVEEFSRLRDDCHRALGADHHLSLGARGNLANRQLEAGDVSGALAAFAELLADQTRLLGPYAEQTLTVRNNLAHARSAAGDTTGAIVELERLLDDLRRVYGPFHPTTLLSRANLASNRADAGDVAGAVVEFEGLAQEYERLLGTDHKDTLTARINLAAHRAKSGEFHRAITELEQLVHDCTNALGAGHPRTVLAWGLLEEGRQAVRHLSDTDHGQT